MSKTIFKNEKEPETELHSYEVGRFGGGTQPPVYLDKFGNKIPFEKTNWFKLKLKKAYDSIRNRDDKR